MRWIGMLACWAGLMASFGAQAEFDEDYETRPWQEVEVVLPKPPELANMLPFFVSAASPNRYFVDGASLTVGTDGVVRYVLRIEAAGGARNTTFEGMRCETRERRVYASGRRDGAWSKSRNNAWVRIQDNALNRHHAALFLEYFCPSGIVVKDADEAREALRRGVHPLNRMR